MMLWQSRSHVFFDELPYDGFVIVVGGDGGQDVQFDGDPHLVSSSFLPDYNQQLDPCIW